MTPRYVLWTRSRGAWVPVIESKSMESVIADAAACAADGLKVVVLPKGTVPSEVV